MHYNWSIFSTCTLSLFFLFLYLYFITVQIYTVNYCAGPAGILSVMLYPLSFSIQTHRFPSAVMSAEMSLVACQCYWQRPCKTHWIQWSKAPVNLRFTSLTPVDRLWCKTECWQSTCLTNTIYCLLLWCNSLPRPISSLYCGFFHQLASEWLLWFGMRTFHYHHISIIGQRLRALWATRDIIWPGSIQNKNLLEDLDAAGFIRQLQRVFEVKKKIHCSKVLVIANRRTGNVVDIDLLRLKIMFKGIRFQGEG